MREIKYQLIWQGAIYEPLTLLDLIKGGWEIDGTIFEDFGDNEKGEKVSTTHEDYNFFSQYKNDYGVWRQFTGIKDKNGVEIYEGDVLSFKNTTYVVDFNEKEGQFRFTNQINGLDVYFTYLGSKNVKILGNIYKNPELLENN